MMTDTLAASLSAYPAQVKDSCGQFFSTCLRAFAPRIPADARVLEIGCAEFNWLATACKAWPEMLLTGIDWRGLKHPGTAAVITGDVMTHDFAPASFDWIVSISAIEHVGLGHYSGDPKREDGDSIAVARAYTWLKPGGWLYFDVPYNPAKYEVVGTSHRIYDDAAILDRLVAGRPWKLAWSGVAAKGDTRTLIPPRSMHGGEHFDYIGFWWQKPQAEAHG